LKPKGYPQKGKQPQSPVTYPTCKDSGRSRIGESMKGSRICYSCKQSEHFKTGAKSTTTSKCRVYYLDGMKAQANIDLITGKFHLDQNLVRVLFDCGITNSFISSKFVKTFQLPLSQSNYTGSFHKPELVLSPLHFQGEFTKM